jgi:hypothetical protein
MSAFYFPSYFRTSIHNHIDLTLPTSFLHHFATILLSNSEDEMEHIQQYMAFYKEQETESSMKFIRLISLMPVVIVLLLICAFPLDDVSIGEQNCIKAMQLSVRSDAQRDRQRVPFQPLQGLSAQEKNLLFCYAAFGKSLRAFGNDVQKSGGKCNSQ